MIEQSNQALNWLINISTPDKDLHFLHLVKIKLMRKQYFLRKRGHLERAKDILKILPAF